MMAMSETFEVGIGAELAEKIRAHGVETYPYECCGALLGRENSSGGAAGVAREVLGLFPLVNTTAAGGNASLMSIG